MTALPRISRCASALLLALALGDARAAAAADGLEPPVGFGRIETEVFGGSRALVPPLAPGAQRELVAAWVDFSSGASMVLGRVEAPLDLGRDPSMEITWAIAGHLRGELDLETTVEASSRVRGAHGLHWEARAATRAGGGARTVRFGFYPAGAVHYVLAASHPPEQEQLLAARLDRVFEEFAPPVEPGPGRAAFVAFGLAGLLLLLGGAVALRRRRRAARSGTDGGASGDGGGAP